MLLLKQKVEIHKKLLQILEERHPYDKKYLHILAHHALKSDQFFKALDHSEQASFFAIENNANEEAVRLLKISLQLYEKLELQDPIRLETLHVCLGESLYSLGHYEDAIESFLSALELTGNPIPKSEFTLKYQPTKSAALLFVKDTFSWAPVGANTREAASSFRAAQILEKLCHACVLHGNGDLAAYSAFKLVELSETNEEDKEYMVVVGYSLCAYITLILQKPDLAEKYAQKACSIINNFPHLPEVDLAMAQTQIGMYTASHGNWNDALWYFRGAKKVFKDYGERKKWRECTLMIGTVLHMQGEFEDCLKHFNKLITYAQEDGDLYLHSSALFWKSLTELALYGASEKIEKQLETARALHSDSQLDHLSIRITLAFNAFHRNDESALNVHEYSNEVDDVFDETKKEGNKTIPSDLGNRSYSMSVVKSVATVIKFASEKTLRELTCSSNLLWYNVYKYVHFLELLYTAAEICLPVEKKLRRQLMDTAEVVLKSFQRSFPFPYAQCYGKFLKGRLEYLKKQDRSAHRHMIKAARAAVKTYMPYVQALALYHIGLHGQAETKAVYFDIARRTLLQHKVRLQGHSQFGDLWTKPIEQVTDVEASKHEDLKAPEQEVDVAKLLDHEWEEISGNSTFSKRSTTLSTFESSTKSRGKIPWRQSVTFSKTSKKSVDTTIRSARSVDETKDEDSLEDTL